MASIGELTAKLILESAEFVAGMKKAADATAQASGRMQTSLHDINRNLKLALGGGVAHEAVRIFEKLNSEARKTSAIYKQFTDSVSAAFESGFGAGVNEKFKATAADMRQLDKLAEALGHAFGGAFATAMSNASKWITAVNDGLERFDKWTGGRFSAAMHMINHDTDNATEAIEANAKSLQAWLTHVKAGIEDMADEQAAYNLAIEQGLDDQAAWQVTFSETAKVTANNNALMKALADDMQQYTQTMADGLADVVVGTKDLRTGLADLAKDLAKMAATNAIKDLLGFAVGAATGTAPNVSATAAALTTDATLLHSGGIVGQTGARRSVPRAAFDAAPRFHSGFMPGELPAILQQGEAVLTRRQMRSLRGGGVNAPVAISIDARGADAGGLARVEAQLREMQRSLPTKIVKTVREARSRRVPL